MKKDKTTQNTQDTQINYVETGETLGRAFGKLTETILNKSALNLTVEEVGAVDKVAKIAVETIIEIAPHLAELVLQPAQQFLTPQPAAMPEAGLMFEDAAAFLAWQEANAPQPSEGCLIKNPAAERAEKRQRFEEQTRFVSAPSLPELEQALKDTQDSKNIMDSWQSNRLHYFDDVGFVKEVTIISEVQLTEPQEESPEAELI
ncbi:MAG TPA: hypothetical protein VGB00_06330 [Pyrinomonadaceae bacterium]|jgi:hypothetical protein